MCEIYGERERECAHMYVCMYERVCICVRYMEREREREALILIESFPKSALKTEITISYAQWEDTEENTK